MTARVSIGDEGDSSALFMVESSVSLALKLLILGDSNFFYSSLFDRK